MRRHLLGKRTRRCVVNKRTDHYTVGRRPGNREVPPILGRKGGPE